MNISNSQITQDQASNANVHSARLDHSEHQNPWPRNADHSRDNQSSDSSDTYSIGHWDSNWQNKKCTACGLRGHTYYNCEKKRKEKENFTARGVTGTHTVMPHVQGNATQAPPDSNTKTTIHPGQTTTQFHQQNQTTTITTTTTQGHHQHPPVLEAMRTSPSNS